MMKNPKNRMRRWAVTALLLANPIPRLLLADRAFDTTSAWQAHDALLHMQICACLFVVFSIVSYQETRIKSAAFAVAVFELFAFFESLANLFFPGIGGLSATPHAAVTSLALAWYLLRRYRIPSDTINETALFICRLKPRTAQDLTLSMLGKSPTGGVALYYAGNLYHYSHGVMVKTPGVNVEKYVIENACQPTPQQLKYLESLVGEKWSILSNCMTELYPLARLGRPLFRRTSP